METELISFRIAIRKSLRPDCIGIRQNRISLKFDNNEPVNMNLKCPVCGKEIKKGKYGYFVLEEFEQKDASFSLGE